MSNGRRPASRPSLNQAIAAIQQGNPRAAIALLEPLERSAADDPAIAHLLGTAYFMAARAADALPRLGRARSVLGPRPDIVNPEVGALRTLGRFDEADALLADALAASPGQGDLLAARGDLYEFQGRWQEALDVLLPAVEQDPAQPSLVIALARVCARAGVPAEARDRAIELARALAAGPALAPARRSLLLFRLGAMLDRAKRHADAFEAFRRGNAMEPMRWDPQAHRVLIASVEAAWTADAVENAPTSGLDSELPVLIVGMPRSGTTLIERMIAAHPKAAGAGELMDLARMTAELTRSPYPAPPATTSKGQLKRLAGKYLASLRQVDHSAERVVDKAPLNFRVLGLLWQMLPKARVIWARRDPLDTCLSCYFQQFKSAFPQGSDLRALGMYLRDSERVMQHWQRTLPLAIHEVSYERLVAEPEAEARQFIGFLGLDWHPAVLEPSAAEGTVTTASYAQVSQPIYQSSVRRADAYAEFLAPLRAGLAE